jgi:Cu2+-exporting ATPase
LAGGLDVDAALGGCLPQQKMARVRELQARGHRVAMVGDGINDAATLAAADVSISFAEANELAQASSDFLVLGDSLEGVARARGLARRTRRTILQNLSWAVGYNALAVPAAMLGLIAPWGAAIGMSASSLLVVANSLRLRRDPKRRRAAAQVANPGARGLAETG